MIKFALMLIIFISTGIVFSESYVCPSLPNKVRFGDKLGDGWVLLTQGKNISAIEFYYYKITSKEYNLTSWDFLGVDPVIKNDRLVFTSINCCSILKNENVCATKIIPKKQCSVNKKPNSYSFDCEIHKNSNNNQ